MSGVECLNCGNHLPGAYCQSCGQPASTHRFSLSHIFAHDFIHAIFHVHKGFFFTLKELFVRPGHMTREFINGQRIKYFNYFTLLVITIAVGSFIAQFSDIRISDIMGGNEAKGSMDEFERISKQYPRLYTFTSIPLVAFFSWLWFRRAKQNYAEHLVLNAYRGCGELLLGMILTISSIFIQDVQTLRVIYTIMVILILSYSIYFYSQYFSIFGYSKLKLFLLSLLTSLSLSLLTFIVTAIVIAINGLPGR